MNLVMLTKEQFDKFSYSHPLHSYYQTSMYANIMKSCNYEVFYFGFTDDENNLVGATMILSQTIIGSYKYAYAPRGFLINYDNKEDLSWLQVLKTLLKERNLEYNDEILKKVTKEITKAGYDIITKPLKLERYK